MASQIYINHKLGINLFCRYYFLYIFSVRMVLISFLENLIDYQYEYREPFKFIYLREELIILILFLQSKYFCKKMPENV